MRPTSESDVQDIALGQPQPVCSLDEMPGQRDIRFVGSAQRGTPTPGFDQGRIACGPEAAFLSEHGVHHFHGLLLDACRPGLNAAVRASSIATSAL